MTSQNIVGLVLSVIIALFAAVMIGSLLRLGRTSGVQYVANVEGARRVTAAEMAATYLDSRTNGDHEYRNRKLLLSGDVTKVSLYRDGRAEVAMDGGTIAEISPRSHALISNVGKGDWLSLLCEGARYEKGRPHARACLFHDAELG